MAAVLVFCALVCFALSAFPKVTARITVVNLFNLGWAFAFAALLVSLGGADINVHVG